MATIVLRAGKGSPLTNAEVDANFSNLNTAVVDAAVTASWASVSGKPATLAGYGITDAQALDADLTAIAALAGTSGFLKKTAANTWALDTSAYLTGNQSISFTGDATGSGTTSVALTLANSGVTAGTYPKVTVDAKGRVTAGAALVAGDVPTLNQSTTGNAATATVLQTARTINGVSFNGSANVTVTTAGTGIGVSGTAVSIAAAYSPNTSTELPVADLNTYQTAGFYHQTANADTSTANNYPVAHAGSLLIQRSAGVTQQYQTYGTTDTELYFRSFYNTVWGAWCRTLTDTNYNSYSPTLTGTGASGTWGISITGSSASTTGNAVTATSLQTGRTIALTGDVTYTSGSFNGSQNVTGTATLANSGVTAGTYSKVTVDAKGRVTAGAALASADLPTYTGSVSSAQITTGLGFTPYNATNPSGYITSSASITGNAATATTLATARTIALSGAATGTATSFNGSANISIAVTGLNASNLNAGTVPDAQLTGTYSGFTHKLDGANTVFTTPNAGSTTTAARTVYGLAEYKSAAAAQVGAIVFIAPGTTSTIMHQLEIAGMLYNQNIVSMMVQGYRTTAAWSDVRKISTGTVDIQTRWAVTPDGKNCLILGDVATSWSYPHFSILRAMFSHSGVVDSYCSGWTVAVVTDLSLYTNVTATIADSTMVGSVSGNAASATLLQTARTINGVSFDGSANITVADATKLPLAGGTMTGAIGFAAGQTWPTFNQSTTGNAATATALATGRTIALTGDVTYTSGSFNGSANVTGTATLANSGVTAGTYTKITVDAKGRATAGTTLAESDIPALTMAKLPGAAYKQSVRCATTANITLSGTQTIDGIAAVAGDRVLVKNQTTASQNGIYVVAAGAWTRTLDSDSADEIGAAVINVDSGTAGGGELWTTTFKVTDTLGTTAMNWYEVLYNTGTWNISVTGSAATLATTRTLWGQNFNGSANVSGALSSVTTLAMSGQLTNTVAVGTAPFVITSTTRVANLNVATAGTADTLTTARTINGVSFNGSANITVADATKLPLSGGTLTGKLNVSGGDSARLLESLNQSASSAAQFYIDHNLAATNIGNARGVLNLVSTGALTIGGSVALTASNYNTYSPTLTGTGASGTWAINVTGTAAGLTGTPNLGFSSSGASVGVASQGGPQIQGQGGGAAMMSFHRPGAYGINFGLNSDNVLCTGGWSRAGTHIVVDTGNIGTYAVPLSGATMSGNLSIRNGSPTLYLQDTDSISAMLHCNGSKVYILRGSGADSTTWTQLNGEWPVYWDLTTNASRFGGSMVVIGSITSTSTMYAPSFNTDSDERIKGNWSDLSADFVEQLANVKCGTYDRIDINIGRRQVGVSAQSLQALMPEAVDYNEESDRLSVSYGNAALSSAVELAKRVVKQCKEIDDLKDRVVKLESLINKLIGD